MKFQNYNSRKIFIILIDCYAYMSQIQFITSNFYSFILMCVNGRNVMLLDTSCKWSEMSCLCGQSVALRGDWSALM